MKHNFRAEYGNLILRPLLHEDIEKLREWRNDTTATKFLRPVGYITPEKQENWFKEYLTDEDIFTFAIVEKKEINDTIGSVSIYNFRGNRAELGKIQIGNPAAHGKGYGRIALVMALKIAFEVMKCDCVDGIVHRDNISARTNDLRVGFKIVGQHPSVDGKVEDIIEIDYSTLRATNSYCNEIQVYGNE